MSGGPAIFATAGAAAASSCRRLSCGSYQASVAAKACGQPILPWARVCHSDCNTGQSACADGGEDEGIRLVDPGVDCTTEPVLELDERIGIARTDVDTLGLVLGPDRTHTFAVSHGRKGTA